MRSRPSRRRGTSERTVREQARSAYQKAGLRGRSELAAFFLGDLLDLGGEPGTAPRGGTQSSGSR